MPTKKEEKFEDQLAKLEEIVRKLESADVALEDAISEFQTGMKLSENLKKTLNDAEKVLATQVGKSGVETPIGGKND
ncbi:MAG: exodeoxyribonuclease VII small subunit [Streptococcaceae bacterium]|jgi:exodeoxyribonuclease VII small subunit|nr:exodeoxyribonuclease VII small subunit [Streptococcaceae bacterium]